MSSAPSGGGTEAATWTETSSLPRRTPGMRWSGVRTCLTSCSFPAPPPAAGRGIRYQEEYYHRLEHATKPGRGLLREIFANIRLKLYSIKSNPPHSSRCPLQGCVDEHARCVEWARGGLCLARPGFMGLTCRESCGTCGFLSPFNTEEQVINKL